MKDKIIAVRREVDGTETPIYAKDYFIDPSYQEGFAAGVLALAEKVKDKTWVIKDDYFRSEMAEEIDSAVEELLTKSEV